MQLQLFMEGQWTLTQSNHISWFVWALLAFLIHVGFTTTSAFKPKNNFYHIAGSFLFLFTNIWKPCPWDTPLQRWRQTKIPFPSKNSSESSRMYVFCSFCTKYGIHALFHQNFNYKQGQLKMLISSYCMSSPRGTFFVWRAPIVSWARIMCSQVHMLNFVEP